MSEVTLELIDLGLDREEEFEKFSTLNEELKEEDTKEEDTKEEDTKEEDTKEEDTKEEDTKEEDTKEEDTKEEDTKEEDTKEEDTKEKENTKTLLEELRAERQRLQSQLNELAVVALVDRRKLAEIEKQTIAKTEKEPEGPTPAEILGQLDQRIKVVDAALTKAEQEDPATAPALRQELRQLERYYTNYLSQQQLIAAQGPDPADLVQLAASEAQQQTAFNAVKQSIIDQFPVLDPKSETFNVQLRDKVHHIYNPMLKEGLDPVESLVEATMLVMRAHGVPAISEIQQMNANKAAADKAAADKAAADKAAAEKTTKPKTVERKEEAVSRNVKAAKAVPPTLVNVGRSSEAQGTLDKYDFAKMSISEFMKISDEEQERIEAALSLYSRN